LRDDGNDEGVVVSFVSPRSSEVEHLEPLASLVYSQGRYYVYHGSDLKMKVIDNPSGGAAATEEEMNPALKELTQKVYVAVKSLPLVKSVS
jgi:hypothetical protein